MQLWTVQLSIDTAPGHVVAVDVGGVLVELASDNGRWLDRAIARYKSFAPKGSNQATVTLNYRVRDPTEPDPRALYRGRQQPITAERRDGQLHVDGAEFRAVIDPAARHVDIDGPMAHYPIDLVMRALWYELCPNGLIIHAAALVDGDRGFLCTGPSGAGKSTLASLFPNHAICDDRCCIERMADDSADSQPSWQLRSLPFWYGSAGGARLESIHHLRHGQTDVAADLEVTRAATLLRQQLIWPAWDEQALARAFAVFADLVASIPSRDLAFRPTPAVWSTLIGAASGANAA